MAEKTIRCPFCGEEILAVAKKCKHCGGMIKSEEELEAEKNFKPLVYGKNKAVKICTWVICCFLCLSFFFIWYGIDNTPSKAERQTTETAQATNQEEPKADTDDSFGRFGSAVGVETTTTETAQEEVIAKSGEMSGGIFYFFGLLVLFPILQMYAKKFILDKDHVTIKKGVIFKKKENIQYTKMNNVQQSEFLGFGGVKIFTGNDKPVVFDNLENYEYVVEFLQKKINK